MSRSGTAAPVTARTLETSLNSIVSSATSSGAKQSSSWALTDGCAGWTSGLPFGSPAAVSAREQEPAVVSQPLLMVVSG